MRLSVALLCACVCGLAATINADDQKTLWYKQKFVLDMLQHFNQNTLISVEYKQQVDAFKWEEYADKFGKHSKQYIEDFMRYYDAGRLHIDVFSSTHEEVMAPTIALYRLFYFAQDWETFQHFAVWSRFHLHTGMFGYAFHLAVFNRADMHNVIVPASYEIYPNLFYTSGVIDRAQQYQWRSEKTKYENVEQYEWSVWSNYTSAWLNSNNEYKLAYFTEDVSINEFFYYAQLDSPVWMDYEEFHVTNPRRGELYLYTMTNFLARYHMERLSNNLGSIPEFSFYEPIEHGYNSLMRFTNGFFFPVRNDHKALYHGHHVDEIERFELMLQRIRDSIDLGYVQLGNGSRIDLSHPESIEVLGNLMQANHENIYPEYFESAETIGQRLLRGWGKYVDGSRIPDVMAWPTTAVRDPMFYQLYNRLLKNYWAFKNHLPIYTEKELAYDNVKFESVDMTKLSTYFEQFDTDFSNGVDVELVAESKFDTAPYWNFGRLSAYKGHDYHVTAHQMRLAHEHFTYTLHLNAVVPAKVLIKTFVGPKYDEFGHEFSLNDMRAYFFELDEAVVELKAGANSIERHCRQFPGFAGDRTTYFELYKQLLSNEKTTDALKFPLEYGYRGFPNRMMLPKGWKSGMPVQFFFYVAPYDAASYEPFNYAGYKFAVHKHQSFGFPLDRKIQPFEWKQYSNMYFFDTVIYHK